MAENKTVQTSVQEVDLDLDSWLSAPGAESILTQAPETAEDNSSKSANIFSKSSALNLDFLNEEEKKEVTPELAETKETLLELDEDLKKEEDKKNPGRPKTEKSGLVEFLKKRIEANEMFAFDDYDEKKQSLEDYLSGLGEKDVEDLWKANIDNLKQEVASKTPSEFFESLPEELQYAAKYVMDGGQDLKGLFQALAATEQVRSLDPTEESDQEVIVRQYLQATNFGDSDEIEEELTTWKDLGVLEKKAKQFKPKLDKMQEEVIQHQLAEQELRKQQQEQAAKAYTQNVFEALKPAEINGLKLDKKTQAQLYSGLVQPQYPSISGRPTNLLGHLLEKYQFIEPNYSLIAEALWLLSDPDAYRSELKKQGKTQAVEQTVKQLKIEQSRRSGSGYVEEEETRTRKINRPQNIFKR